MMTGLYMRVSTMEQANEGYSLPNQKRKLIAYCEAMNWSIFKIYCDEGISGFSIAKRPAVKQMLEDVRAGKIENVLIMKVDRLCRNTKELLEIVDILNKHNVRLNAVDEKIDYTTDVGKMVLTLLGSFAEFERNRISSRMNDGRVQKKMAGLKSGTAKLLYGYKYIDKKYVINPLEAKVVKYIFNSVLENKSYHSIAKEIAISPLLNYDKIVWSPTKIKNIIKNPTYKGCTCINAKTDNVVYFKADNVEPIVSTNTWDNANLIMKERHKDQQYKSSSDRYYFGDVAYCGQCHHKLTTRTIVDHKGIKPTMYYYRCNFNYKKFAYDMDDVPRCKKSFLKSERLEKLFLNYFENLSIQPIKPNEQILEVDNDQLKLEITEKMKSLESKRISLTKKFVEDLISQEDYFKLNNDFNLEYKNLSAKLEELDTKKSAIIENIDYDTLTQFKLTLKECWSLMSDSEKRNFITLHFEKIFFVYDKITHVVFRKAK